MSANKKPLLTVFLLTYNHESYIRDTFESILIQKTKYPFVVKILEDCSTDKTLQICKEYKEKYPQLFTLINQPKNTKGEHCRLALENEIHTPYWCFIEGDDYYIGSSFFEDGLNFLEVNREYNLYCGDTIYDRGGGQIDIPLCKNAILLMKKLDTKFHFIIIHTCILVLEYIEISLILKILKITHLPMVRYICICYILIKAKAILTIK